MDRTSYLRMVAFLEVGDFCRSAPTCLKSNEGEGYLVLDVPLSVFLGLPDLTQVMTCAYGAYETGPVIRIKGELLEGYHLVSVDTVLS